MNFFDIVTMQTKKGTMEVYPDFQTGGRDSDLMVRGKNFYAIWDEEEGIWSTDELDVQKVVDKALMAKKTELENAGVTNVKVKTLKSYSSGSWDKYKSYISKHPNLFKPLDDKLTFADTKTKRSDYVSKRLDYSLKKAECNAYEEIMSTLYSPEERQKLEWAIGSIITGDSRKIQKFFVLYGKGGTGKGTFLKILRSLFRNYTATFTAKDLASNSKDFSMETFSTNPLVAIDEDGDLSRIEDSTRINSIVSHETLLLNEKGKPHYPYTPHCMLFIGSNEPVKIKNEESGLIRRLIDVEPTGNRIPSKRYHELMDHIEFELGGIAWHCLQVYKELGKNAYDKYKPKSMMQRTNPFYNFVCESAEEFMLHDEGISLKTAYNVMWKDYCNEIGYPWEKILRYVFGNELKNYFDEFYDVTRVNGKQVRSWYKGFRPDKLKMDIESVANVLPEYWLDLKIQPSLLDDILKDCKAQYEVNGKPELPWDKVTTTLKDLDTSKVHYILPPEWLWMVDFDLKNEDGEKDAKLNLEAASKWPKTYAEFSKGEAGIHLYYRYTGDLDELVGLYSKDVELKVFHGKSAIRRKVSKCNHEQITTISSGLPKKEQKRKEAKSMVDMSVVEFERYLTNTIRKAIKSRDKDCKDPIPNCEHTKPCIDFIKHILDEAYDSGKHYDVSQMRKNVYAHAMGSTNNKRYCTDLVGKMKWYSKDVSPPVENACKGTIAFFDIEVFPNVNMVNWKIMEDIRPDQFESWQEYVKYYLVHHKPVVRLINPTPEDINELLKYDLIGFNCRKYDNHILHAIRSGFSPEKVYECSTNIIAGNPDGTFREAWDYSYTDIFDFSSKKQSLKKFEIELGVPHRELGMDWTKPVPEERWTEIAEYCDNDVLATELLFWSKDRQADWKARQILVELANGGADR
jgi:hypothetical protein